jgi:hypothetical protein
VDSSTKEQNLCDEKNTILKEQLKKSSAFDECGKKG